MNKKGFNHILVEEIQNEDFEVIQINIKLDKNECGEVYSDDARLFTDQLNTELYDNHDLLLLFSNYDGYYYIAGHDTFYTVPQIYPMSTEMEDNTIPALFDGEGIKCYQVDDIELIDELKGYHGMI
jgi:hypothetical protein